MISLKNSLLKNRVWGERTHQRLSNPMSFRPGFSVSAEDQPKGPMIWRSLSPWILLRAKLLSHEAIELLFDQKSPTVDLQLLPKERDYYISAPNSHGLLLLNPRKMKTTHQKKLKPLKPFLVLNPRAQRTSSQLSCGEGSGFPRGRFDLAKAWDLPYPLWEFIFSTKPCLSLPISNQSKSSSLQMPKKNTASRGCLQHRA